MSKFFFSLSYFQLIFNSPALFISFVTAFMIWGDFFLMAATKIGDHSLGRRVVLVLFSFFSFFSLLLLVFFYFIFSISTRLVIKFLLLVSYDKPFQCIYYYYILYMNYCILST